MPVGEEHIAATMKCVSISLRTRRKNGKEYFAFREIADIMTQMSEIPETGEISLSKGRWSEGYTGAENEQGEGL